MIQFDSILFNRVLRPDRAPGHPAPRGLSVHGVRFGHGENPKMILAIRDQRLVFAEVKDVVNDLLEIDETISWSGGINVCEIASSPAIIVAIHLLFAHFPTF